MTNFEWLMTLSEEEFADWLYDEWLHHLQYCWSSSRGGLILWLNDRKAEPQTIKSMAIGKWSDATADKHNLYGNTTTDEPQTVYSDLCFFCSGLGNKERCDKCGIKQNYEKIGDEPKADCDKDGCFWWASKSNKCIRTIGCVKDEPQTEVKIEPSWVGEAYGRFEDEQSGKE